ncbi:MAG: DUF1573 domain-containing protein [Bacteroidales bacterium]|nr:DUF1573 domain-containing protein [Bacteroidales bacterium]
MRLLNFTGLLILLLIGVACTSKTSTDISLAGENQNGLQPEIRFEKTEYNLGKILQGEKVGYNFTFTNDGDASLVILDASASCGYRTKIQPGTYHPRGKGIGRSRIRFLRKDRSAEQDCYHKDQWEGTGYLPDHQGRYY